MHNDRVSFFCTAICTYFIGFAIVSLTIVVSVAIPRVSMVAFTLSTVIDVESAYGSESTGIVSFFLQENDNPITMKRNAIFDLITVFMVFIF